jgi:hypothetical protein
MSTIGVPYLPTYRKKLKTMLLYLAHSLKVISSEDDNGKQHFFPDPTNHFDANSDPIQEQGLEHKKQKFC